MAKKPYAPVASYDELKRVEELLNQVGTVEDIRKLVIKDGPKVGYKAFCYMLSGKMSAAAMKPDEACVAAAVLEQQGKADEAREIYKKVVEVHPDHAIARSKLAG